VRLKERLLSDGLNESLLNDLEVRAKALIEQAAQAAIDAPLTDTNTILEHLYA
jgi:hypothetical protein